LPRFVHAPYHEDLSPFWIAAGRVIRDELRSAPWNQESMAKEYIEQPDGNYVTGTADLA
jgi:hypothetical protein